MTMAIDTETCAIGRRRIRLHRGEWMQSRGNNDGDCTGECRLIPTPIGGRVKGRRIEATTTTTFDKEIFATMRRQFDCTAANTYDPGVMTTAITLEEANQHLRQSVAGSRDNNDNDWRRISRSCDTNSTAWQQINEFPVQWYAVARSNENRHLCQSVAGSTEDDNFNNYDDNNDESTTLRVDNNDRQHSV